MAFNTRSEYTIISIAIDIRDFFEYKDKYTTRPPYQRKSVWLKKRILVR